jgi:hypothetical protein
MNNSEVSDFLLEKAKRDLREDETRKRQSLEQAREWGMKHPFIKVLDPSVLGKFLLHVNHSLNFVSLENF